MLRRPFGLQSAMKVRFAEAVNKKKSPQPVLLLFCRFPAGGFTPPWLPPLQLQYPPEDPPGGEGWKLGFPTGPIYSG